MTPFRQLTFGLLLTAAAGMIDVVGFIELGGFYTSFMSGNTTQLGAGIARLGPQLLLPAALITMFFLGSFLGSLIAQSRTRGGAVGVLVLILLSLVVSLALRMAGFSAGQAMLALAAGAGAQNAVLTPNGAARLGTTFVSGTLFAAGQDLARAVRGEAPPWRWTQHLMVWASLLVGALIGALLYGVFAIWAILLPGVIYAAILVFQARRK